MKALYSTSFSNVLLAAVFLLAACTPHMDVPDPGSATDPTRPDAPPQVIFMPSGVEVTSLAVQGDYLYATAPGQDQVYRMHIAEINNLSRTANAVPYVRVPGASGIAAGANNTLFIGSSGAPKAGADSHKWTDDQVVYMTQATESWHSRFKNNPAQKLFMAPRGSFNALSVYDGNLYYAAESNLEGMTINSTQRIKESLGAVDNLIPDELAFLIDLAMGNADMSDLDLNKILQVANQFNLDLDLSGLFDSNGDVDVSNFDISILDRLATIGLEGPEVEIPVEVQIKFDIKFNINDIISIIDFPVEIPIDLPVTINVPTNSLSIEPQWGLNLITLWYGLVEVPQSLIEGYIDQLLNDEEQMDAIVVSLKGVASVEGKKLIDPAIKEFVDGIDAGGFNWMLDGARDAITTWAQGEAGKLLDKAIEATINKELITKNLKDADNLLEIIKDYRVERNGGKYISLNGTYKDQPGETPARPYVMGVPISPYFAEDRTTNQKMALTLALLQFKGGASGVFSLVDGPARYQEFLAALDEGDMLKKVKAIVEALELERIKSVINNDGLNERFEAYINFIITISQVSGLDQSLKVALDELYNLLTKFDIRIDFRTLLEAWMGLPDWAELGGTRAGSITKHELLGSLYTQMDNFVEGLGNPWSTVAGWVTSKIPRVNSAQGWWYGEASNPTGIAFGYDASIGGTASWVIDQGILYSRHINWGGRGNGGIITRDDYPYSTEKPAPTTPWFKESDNRWRLDMSGASTGQSPTKLDRLSPQILANCYSVVYDEVNKRVLVSCNDGTGSANKGRIVSVKYKNWSVLSQQFPGFNPPLPRIPLAPATLTAANAEFDIHEYIPADGSLSHPKGMAIKDKYLFIADGDRIVVYYMGHLKTASE